MLAAVHCESGSERALAWQHGDSWWCGAFGMEEADAADVLAEVSAAHQYVLDLQVLFYSLIQLSGNKRTSAAHKPGDPAGAGQPASCGEQDRHGNDVDEEGVNQPPPSAADLQQRIAALEQQLDQQREHTALLDSQHKEALGMLRCGAVSHASHAGHQLDDFGSTCRVHECLPAPLVLGAAPA